MSEVKFENSVLTTIQKYQQCYTEDVSLVESLTLKLPPFFVTFCTVRVVVYW